MTIAQNIVNYITFTSNLKVLHQIHIKFVKQYVMICTEKTQYLWGWCNDMERDNGMCNALILFPDDEELGEIS